MCMSNSGRRPRPSIYLPPLLPIAPGHARTTPQQSALISLLSTFSLPNKQTHTLFSSSGGCVLPTPCASWDPTVHSTQQSAQNRQLNLTELLFLKKKGRWWQKNIWRGMLLQTAILWHAKKKKKVLFFFTYLILQLQQSFSLLYAIFLFTQIFTVATDYNEHTRWSSPAFNILLSILFLCDHPKCHLKAEKMFHHNHVSGRFVKFLPWRVWDTGALPSAPMDSTETILKPFFVLVGHFPQDTILGVELPGPRVRTFP